MGSGDTKLLVDVTPGRVDQAATAPPNLGSPIFIINSVVLQGFAPGSRTVGCGIQSILCSPSAGKSNLGPLPSREELPQKLPGKQL